MWYYVLNKAVWFVWRCCFSSLKVSTVAVGTCSVPSTVTLTNTTVPTITGVQRPPAYARRTPSWWLRKFRSYEDWVHKNKVSDFMNWTMATWMKTPDIMASYVHGRLRGAGWGCSHCPDASLTRISLSPLVTAAEPECFCVCVCMKVCVHICLRVGERAVGAWWTLVLLWGGKAFLIFTPFCFSTWGIVWVYFYTIPKGSWNETF